jgi:hypothetical protein
MTEVLMAASRDASWYQSPGRAYVMHVAVIRDETDCWQPTCNPLRALLDETTGRPAANVPERERCRRPGCRTRWPKQGQ